MNIKNFCKKLKELLSFRAMIRRLRLQHEAVEVKPVNNPLTAMLQPIPRPILEASGGYLPRHGERKYLQQARRQKSKEIQKRFGVNRRTARSLGFSVQLAN